MPFVAVRPPATPPLLPRACDSTGASSLHCAMIIWPRALIAAGVYPQACKGVGTARLVHMVVNSAAVT